MFKLWFFDLCKYITGSFESEDTSFIKLVLVLEYGLPD